MTDDEPLRFGLIRTSGHADRIAAPVIRRSAHAVLLGAAESAGVCLRVGYQHRFRPAHMQLRRMLQAGLVGRIGYLRIHRFWSWPYFDGLDPAGPSHWRRSRAAQAIEAEPPYPASSTSICSSSQIAAFCQCIPACSEACTPPGSAVGATKCSARKPGSS